MKILLNVTVLVCLISPIFLWPLNFAFGDIPFLSSLLKDPEIVYQDGRPWVPTDFNNQKEALGLEVNTFNVAPNLEKAVQFWNSIYTQHTSQQGLLHDIDHLDVVYEKVDFEFINTNNLFTEGQKNKAREKYIEERKKVIEASLNKILKHPPVEELTDFDLKILKMWEKNGGEANMKEAASLDRIRFQLGQSDRIKEAIYLSGRYLPMMEQVFKEANLPTQLTRLVFVESSFNVMARSKVGASGLWQIMPSAARGHLKMNKVVDLRNHPEKATEHAAKMLKFNFQMLGSWPLAITGYNHGPYGVKRLVERNKSKDLGELIETGEGRRFGFASRNFYASFLAVLDVESKATVYFPGIKQANEFKTEALKIKNSIFFKDLVEMFGGNSELAQVYNPHLQRFAYLNKVSLDSKSYVVIPAELKDSFKQSKEIDKFDLTSKKDSSTVSLKEDMKEKEDLKDLLPILNQTRKTRNKSKISKRKLANLDHKPIDTVKALRELKTYRVNRGDTLIQISRQFGVSIKSILSANEMKRSRIKAGQILILPD